MTLDLLRFTTAGAVDDGKSTLIGRLLFDSKQVFEDQLEHVTAFCARLQRNRRVQREYLKVIVVNAVACGWRGGREGSRPDGN